MSLHASPLRSFLPRSQSGLIGHFADDALSPPDLISGLVGAPAGSPIDRALKARPATWLGLSLSYQRLFGVAEEAAFSRRDRLAIAAFTARLIEEPRCLAHFDALLEEADAPLALSLRQEAEAAALPGPYGRYPEGPLSAEDIDGPLYSVDGELAQSLGPRLTAGLEYAHILTLHPRDISAETSAHLARSGWTSAEIVELTQLISFLGYLIRVVAGLRAYLDHRQPHLSYQG